MKQIACALVITLIALAVGCEKTIREPGEPEHGGTFLHASPDGSTTQESK